MSCISLSLILSVARGLKYNLKCKFRSHDSRHNSSTRSTTLLDEQIFIVNFSAEEREICYLKNGISLFSAEIIQIKLNIYITFYFYHFSHAVREQGWNIFQSAHLVCVRQHLFIILMSLIFPSLWKVSVEELLQCSKRRVVQTLT